MLWDSYAKGIDIKYRVILLKGVADTNIHEELGLFYIAGDGRNVLNLGGSLWQVVFSVPAVKVNEHF